MMNKLGNFLFGAFLGALAGAVLALLFAPLKGMAMRERVEDSLVNIRNEVQEAANLKANDLKAELAKLQNKPTP
ncbi:MAG: YtxH domain-containing protein [Chloroflexi bacterium]|nr:YtxH domain-containing protein [Chloroflexota bacterium]